MTMIDEARPLLGKRVICTLNKTTKVIAIGQLLAFGEGGDFEILEDDGMVHYCWPMLDIKEVGPEVNRSNCG